MKLVRCKNWLNVMNTGFIDAYSVVCFAYAYNPNIGYDTFRKEYPELCSYLS